MSLRRLGHFVSLVSGVGVDERGDLTILRMEELGLRTDFVQRIPGKATGAATVTLDDGGHATFVIPRPAAFDCLQVDESLLSRLDKIEPEWLYFGTLAQMEITNLALVERLLSRMPHLRGFYDINLRDGHWTLPLVQRLSSLATVLKLNETEAEMLFRLVYPLDSFSMEEFCRRWSTTHGLEIICVTLGSDGCVIFTGGSLHRYPGFEIRVADTVGAGDAFAAGFLHSLPLPWSLAQKAAFANALGALVASRPGATPAWEVKECHQLIGALPTD